MFKDRRLQQTASLNENISESYYYLTISWGTDSSSSGRFSKKIQPNTRNSGLYKNSQMGSGEAERNVNITLSLNSYFDPEIQTLLHYFIP